MAFDFGYTFEEFKNRQILMLANEGIDKTINIIKDVEGSNIFIEKFNEVKKEITVMLLKAGNTIDDIKSIAKKIEEIKEAMSYIASLASLFLMIEPIFQFLLIFLN